MRCAFAIVVALAACRSASPRESDCDRVRAAVAGASRRYLAAMLTDKLAATKLEDADVADAVRSGDVVKLETLCGPVLGTKVDARRADCALVRMWVPSADEEANGVGIFDPTVPKASFRDPEIRAAMKELVDSGWAPGRTAGGSSAGSAHAPDPRVAKLRALCGYPR